MLTMFHVAKRGPQGAVHDASEGNRMPYLDLYLDLIFKANVNV
jgi:hypothetical protein